MGTSWIFELEHLRHTPSADQGSELKDELAERSKGVDFLFRVGINLNLTLTPLYTAATYLHRFYMRYSLVDYDYHDSSMACLFLAAKIEETSRKIADLSRMAMTKARNLNIEKHDWNAPDTRKELEKWQRRILTVEEVVIDVLCFDFFVTHPHSGLTVLFESWPEDQQFDEPEFLEATTWTVANDSYRTPICVLADPKVAAYACFIVASQAVGRGAVSDFLAMCDHANTPVPQPSDAEIARSVLNVEHRDFRVVQDCLTLLRDYYSSLPEQAGRFTFVDALASLPLPDQNTEYFPDPHANGHSNGNGREVAGDRTPHGSDGGRTPVFPGPVGA
ncbi:cyclin-like protein [Exidia glandulosa HHB12029]|uniref:Cyclin-like protein n=1 Tax=Exidia glandulosa HHB12029 TaxID=1314781 RepID=A0A165LCE8_EXIGL|nr:cyclin-like protein [Exidia glandulosa HHB12029]